MPMTPSRASVTAIVTAFSRALHAERPGPKVFDDFLAPALFTPEEAAELRHNLAQAARFLDPAAGDADEATLLDRWQRQPSRVVTLPRSRYAEAALESSGADQYVLLGAGLDTYAYRRPEAPFVVFEVDHPDSQADKRGRLDRLGRPQPANLRFVGLDLRGQDLAAGLAAAGFDPARKTFWSWLGVSYYLPREAVVGALGAIARLSAPGSTLIFDYLDPDAFDPARRAPDVAQLLQLLERVGEPFVTAFDPAALPALLAGLGLHLDEDLSPAELQARYLAGHEGYRSFAHIRFARASVQAKASASSS